MSAWKNWMWRPQNTSLHRILLQVHLWVGIPLALYIVMISLTGSALVFRREITDIAGPVYVTPREHRLTQEELASLVSHAFPGFRLEGVSTPRVRGQIVPDQAIEVQLNRGDDSETVSRLLDPYTGADLGDTTRPTLSALLWLADLHDNLLAGRAGRVINGMAAVFVILLACTGAVLWWPGTGDWRGSLTIDWKRKRYGFHWSVHSAVGFWTLSFIVLWAVSGVYFGFPGLFSGVVDYLEPLSETEPQNRIGDQVLFWLAR